MKECNNNNNNNNNHCLLIDRVLFDFINFILFFFFLNSRIENCNRETVAVQFIPYSKLIQFIYLSEEKKILRNLPKLFDSLSLSLSLCLFIEDLRFILDLKSYDRNITTLE
ncbi:hypothetical protein NH340_JMT06802 [Sarcoptes scabiei]|nr:hypothetical protein NH340_JMT06802 [Sarcoptes scabiei]